MNDEPPLDQYDGQPRTRGGGRARSPIDKLPPHSPEAEQGVLSCIFLDPNVCIPETIEKLKVVDAFYGTNHQLIIDAMWTMFDEKRAIDPITVQQYIKDNGDLAEVGGVDYIASLVNMVPSATHLPFYINIVREKYILRRVVRGCTDVVAKLFAHEGEVSETLDSVEKVLLNLTGDRIETKPVRHAKDIVHQAINHIERLHENQGKLLGLSYGFPDLDKMTQGMRGGEMIVIAARPSIGKTSLALNIAEAVAIDQKIPVGVFSLEMSSESLMVRMICSRARVNLRNINEGFLSERDFPKITGAAGRISAAPLYIDDSSGLSVMELRAKARRMYVQYGIKLFVIDYLQLLHSTNQRCQNRQQEIADISNGIKGISKELDVPVIVAAQLNREMERDKRKKPRMSDLRESGAIEQDADLIGLLYKPHAGDAEDEGAEENQEAIPVNMFIAKQRNGPTGDVNFSFLKSYTRFESAAKISADSLPI